MGTDQKQYYVGEIYDRSGNIRIVFRNAVMSDVFSSVMTGLAKNVWAVGFTIKKYDKLHSDENIVVTATRKYDLLEPR